MLGGVDAQGQPVPFCRDKEAFCLLEKAALAGPSLGVLSIWHAVISANGSACIWIIGNPSSGFKNPPVSAVPENTAKMFQEQARQSMPYYNQLLELICNDTNQQDNTGMEAVLKCSNMNCKGLEI